MPFGHPHVALMPDAHGGKGSASESVSPQPISPSG
ncbi:MAG: hypothetical protein QOK18_5533 [Mycobacterium sp.]|jgi:hypothetical protein|nr:hypothetical protein [Mycobacterium sp.]